MRPFIEPLESRELLSASVSKHVAELRRLKHHHAKTEVRAEVSAAVPAAAVPVAWNDLAGTWAGTFSNNVGLSGSISADFQKRLGASNTGTFYLSGLIGQTGCVTTTTPDAYGNVLITVPVRGGIVSFVAGISYDGKILNGRWCTHIGSVFATGLFTMHRT